MSKKNEFIKSMTFFPAVCFEEIKTALRNKETIFLTDDINNINYVIESLDDSYILNICMSVKNSYVYDYKNLLTLIYYWLSDAGYII